MPETARTNSNANKNRRFYGSIQEAWHHQLIVSAASCSQSELRDLWGEDSSQSSVSTARSRLVPAYPMLVRLVFMKFQMPSSPRKQSSG